MATVKVSIYEARDLPVMDRTTGLADPYVVVKLGDMEDMTGICQKTRNPIWRKDFRFDAPNALVLQEDPLEIRVYDHDIISRDDLVGLVFFDINSIITSQQQQHVASIATTASATAAGGGVVAGGGLVGLATPYSVLSASSAAVAGNGTNNSSLTFANSIVASSVASGQQQPSSALLPPVPSCTASITAAAAAGGGASSGSSGSTIVVSGWFPLYDTMEGIRGELRLTIKIKFQSPENPVAPRVPVREVRVLAPLSTILSASSASTRGSPAGVNNNNNSSIFSFRPANMSANDLVPLGHKVSPPASPGFSRQSVVDQAAASVEQPSLLSFVPMLHDSDLAPLQVVQSALPSLMAEEEGVFIYSMSRLDPSLYRVEAVRGLVEELIVKADPEHSKFTTLRSSRSTNEARLLQLYKLSGKVRRLIARRATEQGCNAVLGYQEVFDMDPNGIIVRALGTTCIVSDVVVTHVVPDVVLPPPAMQQQQQQQAQPTTVTSAEPEQQQQSLPQAPTPSSAVACSFPDATSMAVAPSWMVEYSSDCEGGGACSGGGVKMSVQLSGGTVQVLQPAPNPATAAIGEGADTAAGFQQNPYPPKEILQLVPPVQQQQQQEGPGNVSNSATANPPVLSATSRQAILVLTIVEVPSGILVHIGGLVAARSVKLVSRMKNRTSISQERDTWWQEVREEIKANARSFHCNAIIAYRETMTYHEDAVILSCSGTAVVIDTTWLTMRTSSQFLYSRATEKAQSRLNCSILHVYSGRPHPQQQQQQQQKSTPTTAPSAMQQGDLNNLCELCHLKNVPEVLVASSMIPVDVSIEGTPRLLICKAQREKQDVRGRDLALSLSQAIPFLEFTLHKQLMYQLRANRLNAAFGVEVHFAVSSTLVVATLVATGCRVVGIPIPLIPRVEFEADTAHLDQVIKLKQVIARDSQQNANNSTTNNNNSALRSRNGKLSSKRKKEGSAAASVPVVMDEQARGRMPLSSTANSSAAAVDDSFSTASESGENETWASSESSENGSGDEEDPVARRSAPVAEYVVYIDDAEEAQVMLGAFDFQPFPDPGFLVSVPYIPSEANAYRVVEMLELIRRYPLPESVVAGGGSTSSSTYQQQQQRFGASAEYLYRSTSNAVNAFIYHALNALVAHQLGGCCERQRASCPHVQYAKVFAFRMELSFSANSEQLHFRLSGALAVSNDEIRSTTQLLEDTAFAEAERHLSGGSPLQPGASVSGGGGGGGAVSRVKFADPALPHRGSIGSSSAVAAAAGGTTREQSAIPTALDSSAAAVLLPHRTIIRRGHRQLFSTCNAPFSFPFVASRILPPSAAVAARGLPLLFAREEATVPDAAASLTSGTDSAGRRRVQRVLEAGDRATMVRRQWSALTSLVSTTLRNASEKAGIPFLSKASGVNHVPLASTNSQSGSSALGSAANRVQPSTAPELIFPSCRLPLAGGPLAEALEEYCAPIVVTPLSFSPGDVIVRLISRFSHHFIREEYHVESPADFNNFFIRATSDIHRSISAMVKILGGNALLNYAVDTHEVWDSDGTGGAFIFLTVTGHVARIAKATLRDDYLTVDT